MLSLLLSAFLFSTAANAAQMRVTRDEALVFCKQVWFPKLRLEAGLSEREITEKLDQLLTVYHSDAALSDPNNLDLFGKAVITGADEIRKYYRAVLSKYPDWKFEIVDVYPTEKGFVLKYIGKDAPPVKKFDGVDILEIERGNGAPETFQIRKLEEYYDRLPFTQTR